MKQYKGEVLQDGIYAVRLGYITNKVKIANVIDGGKSIILEGITSRLEDYITAGINIYYQRYEDSQSKGGAGFSKFIFNQPSKIKP